MGKCQVTEKSLKIMMDVVYKDVIDNAKKSIDKSDKEIEQLGKKISALLRIKEQATVVYKTYSNYDTTAIQAQIQQIAELPKVDLVELTTRENTAVLNIHTIPLYCTVSNGGTYLVGRYKIGLEIGTSDINIKNLDEENRRCGYWGEACHHPHVSYNGNACFGNIRELLAQLCNEHQYIAIVDTLINFLECANINNAAGLYVANWDLVDPVTKKLLYKGVGTKAIRDFSYDRDSWKRDGHKRRLL